MYEMFGEFAVLQEAENNQIAPMLIVAIFIG